METITAALATCNETVKSVSRHRFCSKRNIQFWKPTISLCATLQIQNVTALHSLERESGSTLCGQSRSWARLCPWRWWCLCKSTCSLESEGCDLSPLSPIAGEPHEDSYSKFLLTETVINFLKLSIYKQIFACYFRLPGHQTVILIDVGRYSLCARFQIFIAQAKTKAAFTVAPTMNSTTKKRTEGEKYLCAILE